MGKIYWGWRWHKQIKRCKIEEGMEEEEKRLNERDQKRKKMWGNRMKWAGRYNRKMNWVYFKLEKESERRKGNP